MSKPLLSAASRAVPAVILAAAVLLVGCDFNALYKKDTGSMAPVAAPDPSYTPIAFQEPVGATDDGGMSADQDAAPEVLAGEGPDAIQPLDEAEVGTPVEPEVMETYVVEKGDTLGHISQKLFGTIGRTKDLMNANPGINPKRMQIGDVINVPR